jgi:hypothetical protein
VRTTSNRAKSRFLAAAAVAGFACILAVEVTLASRELSATWDEPYSLLAGFRYWEAGDFGINPEHPPLAKLVAALRLLPLRLKVPFIGSNVSGSNCTIQGRALVFGDDADAILLRSRLAVAVFALVLIFLLLEARYDGLWCDAEY